MSTHKGGCHCGNLRLILRLTQEPGDVRLRACGCSFCRANQTRTASDPNGAVEIWADDWSDVSKYRFGTGTADFLVCRRCGIYLGAVTETADGTRMVTNTNCLDDRALFTGMPAPTDHDGEAVESRVARRAANWTPAIIHV
jgi:hypothetical protein